MVHRAPGSVISHAATRSISRNETLTKYQNLEIEVKWIIITGRLSSFFKHDSNPGPKFQFLQRENDIFFPLVVVLSFCLRNLLIQDSVKARINGVNLILGLLILISFQNL